MCKLNNQLFKVDKPKNWLSMHFEEMILIISNYQQEKRFKPKIEAYYSAIGKSYILTCGDDIYRCKNLREICELLYPIYQDIKIYNDNKDLEEYKKKHLKDEVFYENIDFENRQRP